MNSEFPDDVLLQLERELKSLTPVAPSRALMQRLTPVMHPTAAPAVTSSSLSSSMAHFPWKRMVTPAAAAAAAMAVMSLLQHRRGNAVAVGSAAPADDEAAPTIKWTPMPMKKEYRSLVDSGYMLDENHAFHQGITLDALEQHEWRNPQDNSSIRLIIPKQESFLLPAAADYR